MKVEQVTPYNSSENKAAQIERMFNEIAENYDTLNQTLSMGIDRSWRKKGLACLKSAAPQCLLDVATGTGDLALEAMRVLNPAEITGIDLSEEMMKIAAQKAAKAGFGGQPGNESQPGNEGQPVSEGRPEPCQQAQAMPEAQAGPQGRAGRIRFAKGDCCALTFADNSFDAVTVGFGVRNFESLNKGLQEILRVLKPGGRLMILELSTPENPLMKVLYKIYSRLVIPALGRLMSKSRKAYSYLPESIAAFPQNREMTAILESNGFHNVSCKSFTFGICSLYLGEKPVETLRLQTLHLGDSAPGCPGA